MARSLALTAALGRAAILGVVALSLAACNGFGPPKITDKDLERIEYPALLDMLAQTRKRTVLVDVRSAAKYEAGHIPQAINIPIEMLAWQDPRLMDADQIVVYAGGWTDYASAAAAKKLLQVGYKTVYDFRGGMDTWQAYGGQIVP